VCEDVGWIHLAQERGQWRAFVNTVMNLQVPYMAGDFLTSFTTISFSGTLPHEDNRILNEEVTVRSERGDSVLEVPYSHPGQESI
jgi:hypothetical protein